MSARLSALSVALLALTGVAFSCDSPSRAEQATAKDAPKATSPEEAIRQALAKPVDLKFVETSLADVIKSLEKHLAVQIRLDVKALDDVGLDGSAPVTFHVSGISARSALELILRQLDLTCIIAHELLLITTAEEAETKLTTEVYDVADLVVPADDPDQADFESLIDLITVCIQPTTWDCVGGPGSIAPFQAAGITAIVFSQTQEVHEEVETLLADIRKARQERPGKADAGEKPEKPKAVSPAKQHGPEGREEAIRRALAKPVTVPFTETPLSDVVEFLKEKTSIQIIIDQKALDDVGMTTDTPVTVNVVGVKLRSALDLMLRQSDLTWTIAHEVLLITTQEEAETMLRARVYDVSDLPAFRNAPDGPIPDYDSLIETITATVEPESWDTVGGPGSIAPYDAIGIQVLVVSQTWKVHEEIEALLDKLRNVYGKGSGN